MNRPTTQSYTAWNFTTKMFTLTQTGTTTIKLSKDRHQHQNNYYTNFVSQLNSH
jgi:hypothetical protein